MRLCVETLALITFSKLFVAAAFVRLCVETQQLEFYNFILTGSRLRAAVC